jgi:hypothetical protein
VVLTASRGTEYSFEGEPLHGEDTARGSVFTGALVDGIRTGAADTDHDGRISVDDAYTYAFDRVRRAGTSQTPQRWLYGAEGEILLAHTPPPLTPGVAASSQVPDQDQHPEEATTGSPTDPPARPPSGQAPPDREGPGGAGVRPTGRKKVLALAAVAVVVLLGAALLVRGLLSNDPGDPTPESAGDNSGSSSTRSTSATKGTISSAKAPWRIVIRDHIEGSNDVGCDVTLTNTKTQDQRSWQDLYGPFRSYQMADSGSYRYEVSVPGCLVLARRGAGSVKLPFAFQTGIGDTDAFRTSGPVEVEAVDFSGNSSCGPELHALGDGRVLDFGDIARGAGPVTLDPQGESLVYLTTPDCGVRVTAAK